jgi:cysteine desulfurase
MARVYLDYNATVPMRPPVAEALALALGQVGNPSSVHAFGREARRLVEEARDKVAALVGAAPGSVIFTSGGTEANNLALQGCGRRVVASAIEHVSVLEAVPDAMLVAATADGVFDLDALERALVADERPAVVSVMLANNETGVIQPVAEAGRLARAHGAIVHCDAVQACGRIDVDVGELGVDLLTISAHKLGGPQGAGALILRDGVALAWRVRGGGQERGRRAGTENVAAIVGFGVAADLARDVAAGERARIAHLRDELERRARAVLPDVRIPGQDAPRLPNTTCLVTPGLDAATQVMALDLAGVAVSAGAACSSGRVKSSHVLKAMGLEEDAAHAIRISLGWGSVMDDVDRFIEAWRGLLDRRGRLSSGAERALSLP